MAVFSKDLGIDLGTMFTRIADSTQVLMQEPTIVAIEVDEQKMVAAGQEARDMLGRVPDNIEVARPLRNGVIADYEITETLLSYLLQRVSGSLRVLLAFWKHGHLSWGWLHRSLGYGNVWHRFGGYLAQGRHGNG